MAAVALPIDPLLDDLVTQVRETGVLVLVAEPGAGKTTRVPRALLERGGITGEIVVLEPRRLAARLSAERVAEEMGEPVGQTVGYQTRFERAGTGATRLRYVTEGILTRRLLADPTLRGVSAVVLDELHERHLSSDVSLAMLRALRQTKRPDLAVIAMSATLDAGPVAAFLGARVVEAKGRTFPVTVEHAERSDDRPLASQVASALAALLARGLEGDVLVFLPGAREIRLAQEACARLAREHDLAVLPLYGSLPVAEQDRAVKPASRRKVVLATNVAETSVTIDGVVAVIDAGLAQIASVAPWSGMPRLRLQKVAKAAATQRAGRAGRTRPGHCVRLYTAGDLAARPTFEAPEIARLDLAEPVLELVAQGHDPATFAWFEPPPAAALAAATELLSTLGAISGAAITPVGRRMLAFPTHPRLARVLVEAEDRGVAELGCAAAAVIGERSFVDERDAWHGAPERSDVLALAEELHRATRRGGHPARGIDLVRAQAADRVRAQLSRIAADRVPAPPTPDAREDAALIAILSGFLDRVGRLRFPEASTSRAGVEIVFAAGQSAVLAPSSRVRTGDLVVALDAEERLSGTRTRTVVRLASQVRADWLLELAFDRVVEDEALAIPPGKRRVEAIRTLRYGALVLDETRAAPTDLHRAARVLADAVLARGLSVEARDDLERLGVRLALLRQHRPNLGVPAFDPADLAPLVAQACEGRTSFDELEGVAWAALVEASLEAPIRRALDELVPERVRLHGGRTARVVYERAAPPSLSSRMQDFFGLTDGPRILAGALPLTLHLCAPNHRAVQVTTDLAGFWDRHYPAIAKELRRKYPRHPFPDDPRTAVPPPPRR